MGSEKDRDAAMVIGIMSSRGSISSFSARDPMVRMGMEQGREKGVF